MVEGGGAPEKGTVGPMCQEGGDEKHRKILTEVGGRYIDRKNERVGKSSINNVWKSWREMLFYFDIFIYYYKW